MAARRRGVGRDEAEAAGRELAARLAGCPVFLAARRVAFYAALPDELIKSTRYVLTDGFNPLTRLGVLICGAVPNYCTSWRAA